jgi:DNA-binding NarL/FixJ family response regulator
MANIRILIADDHEVVRRGLCALLTSHPGWEICAEVADGRQAVVRTGELKPDVVILDLGMPNMNGLVAARQILRENPKQRVLILTVADSEQVVREAVQTGARGFVLKSDASQELIAAVEALLQNRTHFTSVAGQVMLQDFVSDGDRSSRRAAPKLMNLTAREREIVQLLAEGKTSKEVANILNVSVKTAETHRSNLMRKLGIHSLSEVVLYAVRNNIVQVQGFTKQGSAR